MFIKTVHGVLDFNFQLQPLICVLNFLLYFARWWRDFVFFNKKFKIKTLKPLRIQRISLFSNHFTYCLYNKQFTKLQRQKRNDNDNILPYRSWLPKNLRESLDTLENCQIISCEKKERSFNLVQLQRHARY